MGMAVTHTPDRWTVDMLHSLPDDGQRYEIIDGALLVTPSPSFDHQSAVVHLVTRLQRYLDGEPVGYLRVAPGDVEFDRETLVQPDVFVVAPVNGNRPRTWREAGRPLLAIEILSPSTARADRGRKRELYQHHGVPEYWIVDPDSRLVERWWPGDDRPEILAGRVRWQPEGAKGELVIELAEYWQAVFTG